MGWNKPFKTLVLGGSLFCVLAILVFTREDRPEPQPKTVSAPTVPGEAPQDFTGRPDPFSGVQLRWKHSNNPHLLGYAVDRSTDGQHFDRYVAITLGAHQVFDNEVVFSDNNVIKGESFWYRVRTIKTVGQGQPTKIVKVTP